MTTGTVPVLIGRERELRALTELIGKGATSGQAGSGGSGGTPSR